MPIDLNAKRTLTPGNGFSALPDRQFTVTVEEVAAKTTKANDDMVSVRMRVNAGQPFANRCVFANFVVGHSNPDVAKIAQERLDSLLVAARGEGDWALSDMEDAVVTIKTKGGEYHYPVARDQAPAETTPDTTDLAGEVYEEDDAPPF